MPFKATFRFILTVHSTLKRDTRLQIHHGDINHDAEWCTITHSQHHSNAMREESAHRPGRLGGRRQPMWAGWYWFRRWRRRSALSRGGEARAESQPHRWEKLRHGPWAWPTGDCYSGMGWGGISVLPVTATPSVNTGCKQPPGSIKST